MPPAAHTVRPHVARIVIGLITVAALGLTLTGTAYAADRKSALAAVAVGTTVVQRSAGPMEVPYGSGNFWDIQIDQRKMSFGAQWSKGVLVERRSNPAVPCGVFELEVTRCQAYSLHWRAPDGRMNGRLLYRGGLIADYNRPYVGVFFLPGNKLEIRTYNLTADGKVVNAWTAASTTVPGTTLVMERDGISARTGTGKPVRVLTGPTGC